MPQFVGDDRRQFRIAAGLDDSFGELHAPVGPGTGRDPRALHKLQPTRRRPQAKSNAVQPCQILPFADGQRRLGVRDGRAAAGEEQRHDQDQTLCHASPINNDDASGVCGVLRPVACASNGQMRLGLLRSRAVAPWDDRQCGSRRGANAPARKNPGWQSIMPGAGCVQPRTIAPRPPGAPHRGPP